MLGGVGSIEVQGRVVLSMVSIMKSASSSDMRILLSFLKIASGMKFSLLAVRTIGQSKLPRNSCQRPSFCDTYVLCMNVSSGL